MFSDNFFHGIHGPDFAVDAAGVADFGSPARCGHIGIWSPQLQRNMAAMTPEQVVGLGVGRRGKGDAAPDYLSLPAYGGPDAFP